MEVYNRIEKDHQVIFNLPDYLKWDGKKILYAKVKHHMNSLSEQEAKFFLQQITKNKFLDVLKLEVKLIDLYS